MHGAYLRQMLEPLGIYSPDAPYSGGELDAQGLALDRVEALLDENLREADLTAAESWGLEKILGLLACRPAASTPKRMREALAALLRIGGDSFTLEAINDTISGCGVRARVDETGTPGEVEVSFPNIPGIPDGFEEISRIIEDILPAHLLIRYVYWYVTWAYLEGVISCWKEIEDRKLNWKQLETVMAEEPD
ncbi:MAG: DUF2313 domain-containing protein [Lawsonibacter sp.]|nr:DUF2313 domain-containing protein [Lawsonibacter sp.]